MKSLILILISITLFAAPLRADNSDIITNDKIVLADNLHEAVKNIDIISLNVLLADGAEVDTMDEMGMTPLMLASGIGNMRMLNILLMHDPDVNLQNKAGETALMIASENGQLFVAKALLKHGANPDIKNAEGDTAKILAVKNGHNDLIRLFNGEEVTPYSR